MQRMFTIIGAAAIALGIGLTGALPATAAPIIPLTNGPLKIENQARAEPVGHRDWRRRHHDRSGFERRHHRRYGWDTGYSRRHRSGDYWNGSHGRRGHGYHRRHNLRFGIYFN